MKTKENRPSAATLRRRVEMGACGWLTPSFLHCNMAVGHRQHDLKGGV